MTRSDVELLANAYSLATFSALRGKPIDNEPVIKEMLAENHYTKFQGVLDIEGKKVELQEF